LEPKDGGETPAEHRMKVRILQTAPELGGVAANTLFLEKALQQSSGCDLVITSELATHGYDLGTLEDVQGLDSRDPGLVSLGSHGVPALVGFVESADGVMYNSAILLGGEKPVVQRKLTLPSYGQWKEREIFTPGEHLHTSVVSGVTVGTLICNDAWQPQLAWILAQKGAEVICVPANSVTSEVGLSTRVAWEKQLTGLAIALQVYIIFVNRVGTEPCGTFWGGSAVYAPNGTILARADSSEAVVDVDLDIGLLREMRMNWPLLGDPRWDVVRSESKQRHAVADV
jgi:predicted amidohydrolase